MEPLKYLFPIFHMMDEDHFFDACKQIESDSRIVIIDKKPLFISFFGSLIQEYETKDGLIRVIDDYDQWLDVHVDSDCDLSFLGWRKFDSYD